MHFLLKYFLRILFLIAQLQVLSAGQELPTVYEHYSEGGIESGLTANNLAEGFLLNGKPIRIMSASVHYFRVHPDYWRDRLKKVRAAGLNAVDTYVPWNLHEPEKDHFDFGSGANDMSMFLDLRRYIQMAQEEDLLVIFRPGPYICSEWEFGGLPSWLSRDPELKVRSTNPAYHARVKKYFDALLPLVADLQWMQGGSIIMIQIENEYGVFGTMDFEHLEFLKSVMEENGLNELLFTSDSPLAGGDKGALPGVLQTANFRSRPESQLDRLLELQPDKPIFIAEFWAGWFDHWLEWHQITTLAQFTSVLETVLKSYNGSVNFYMFHGGTSYGFMAGANESPVFPNYLPDTSSYDYSAPLSESGDYTAKYTRLRELVEQYKIVPLHRPDMIPEQIKFAYPNVTLQHYLTLEDILQRVPSTSRFKADKPLSMEMLPMNHDSGQSYGYILYRTNPQILWNGTVVKIGRARDLASLIIGGQLHSKPWTSVPQILTGFGYWIRANQELTLNLPQTSLNHVDLLVENMGRVNFGGPSAYLPQKGLHEGNISINGVVVNDLEIFALEFKSEWVKSLEGWRPITETTVLSGPVLIQSTFEINGEPQDTFINTKNWHKGIIFINGFNMGRYFGYGPPTTMYIAAPFLKTGTNVITIFEQFNPSNIISFADEPDLGPILVPEP